MIERETIHTGERNVIVSHQFYIGGAEEPERSESEIITVGNIDSVSAEYLEIFDYAALGHIHKAAKVGKDTIRYCGSPLSYSVSEAGQQKGFFMVELREKGEEPRITTLPLEPLRKVRKIEGVLSELLQQEKSSDFVSILLKDEEEAGEARQRLLEIFDHILEIRLDNAHIREVYEDETIVLEELNPMEIFKQFYQEIVTKEISPEQETLLREIIQECDEEELGCGQ
jgi:exonuclease SbcD